VLTTTTHVWEPVLPNNSALLLSTHPDAGLIQRLLRNVAGLVLAAARLTDVSTDPVGNPAAPVRPVKLAGLSAEVIDDLSRQVVHATWLIEADGARGRSLKVPAAHEPPIPRRATVVCVITSLDAIGCPLDDSLGHRAEQLAKYLGIDIGDAITVDHVARLLVDPAAGLKNIPHAARAIAVLSQRDDARPHPRAKTVAGTLLASGQYERVVVASLRAAEPVLEVFAV
jgi:probable selenium-dependent hydroxylase accessory protein YqeC